MERSGVDAPARTRQPARKSGAAVLVVTLLALGWAAAAAPAATVPDPGGDEEAIVAIPPAGGQAFGFNDLSIFRASGAVDAATLAEITRSAGANIHRITVNWQQVEPEKDVISEVNWARYEAAAAAFRARGQRFLITLSPAPVWARDPGLTGVCSLNRTCAFPPAEHMLGQWREYVAEVVRRFPGAVIETWNEPNIDKFWAPYPQPARWARLHAETYVTAKAVDPSVTVLAGGFAGTISSSGRQEMTLRTFLQKAYATGLLRHTVDALSVHLYSNNQRAMGKDSLFAHSLFDLREVRDANGDAGKSIWVTETGLSTSGVWALTPEKQADGLIRRYKRLMTMPDIGGLIIHTALDQKERLPSDRAYGFGIVANHAPLVVKPAFCEFAGRAMTNPPGGCRHIVDVPEEGSSGDPVLDEIIAAAPKTAKHKARSRCKTWNKARKGFKRTARAKRKRRILRCVGRYLAVRDANRAALNRKVLRKPRKACKRKAARAKRRKARTFRLCVGRRSLRELNRLYVRP